MSNGEEQSVEKIKTFDFLMLSDDMVLNCLARVSRLHYPIISLVSKRLHSLLYSTKLYQIRTLLGRTESCLYVCLLIRNDSNPLRWFTLCRTPNSPSKVLVPISSPLPKYLPAVALVGTNLYVIGGSINKKPLSSVMVMDCLSHTWREGPSMRATRVNPSACVLDGKIYVVGGQDDTTNWMEVFDTKTETWEFLRCPGEEICRNFTVYQSIGYDGKVYVKSEKRGSTYELHRSRWRSGPLALDRPGFKTCFCVIDNVLYYCYSCMIHWYDSEQNMWERVKGLSRFSSGYVHSKAANYGGKMVVLWEENVYVNERHHEKKIWCAEITIDRSQKGEIWGTLEWFDVVFSTTNEPFDVLAHVFSATL